MMPILLLGALAACCGAGAAVLFLRLPARCVCDYDEPVQVRHLPQNRRMPVWGWAGLPLVCTACTLAVLPLLHGGALRRWVAGAACAAAFGLLLAAAWCDAVYSILPDELLLAACVPALVLWGTGAAGWQTRWYTPLVAGAAGFLGLWAVQLLAAKLYKTEAMGFGDVKLLGVLGLLCGGAGLCAAVCIAVLCAALVFAVLLCLRRLHRRDRVPFGPFLVLGALGALALWDAWHAALRAYWSLLG